MRESLLGICALLMLFGLPLLLVGMMWTRTVNLIRVLGYCPDPGWDRWGGRILFAGVALSAPFFVYVLSQALILEK